MSPNTALVAVIRAIDGGLVMAMPAASIAWVRARSISSGANAGWRATSAITASAAPMRSVLTETLSVVPSQPAPAPIVPPSASTSCAICVAERVAVPLVSSVAINSAVPARPVGSLAAPAPVTRTAAISGTSWRLATATRRPLARVRSLTTGTGTGTGTPGGGGRMRCVGVAATTIATFGGTASGATATVAATAGPASAAAPGAVGK